VGSSLKLLHHKLFWIKTKDVAVDSRGVWKWVTVKEKYESSETNFVWTLLKCKVLTRMRSNNKSNKYELFGYSVYWTHGLSMK